MVTGGSLGIARMRSFACYPAAVHLITCLAEPDQVGWDRLAPVSIIRPTPTASVRLLARSAVARPGDGGGGPGTGMFGVYQSSRNRSVRHRSIWRNKFGCNRFRSVRAGMDARDAIAAARVHSEATRSATTRPNITPSRGGRVDRLVRGGSTLIEHLPRGLLRPPT